MRPVPITSPSVMRPPGVRLRLRAIACEALARPLAACVARSRNAVDIELLRQGLHDSPPTLRLRLQAAIDRVAADEYDAVVLAYGLCGGASAGIRASTLPVVLPRAHDCITLFLGSRRRYLEEFTEHPGTYWYVAGEAIGSGGGGAVSGLLGIGASSDDDLAAVYEDYVARYGRDNAEYLVDAIGAWRARYDRAALIETGLDGDPDRRQVTEEGARQVAERRGWRLERVEADLALLARLVAGEWDDDFLVLRPGQRLAMSFDEGVVRATDEERAEAERATSAPAAAVAGTTTSPAEPADDERA